MLLHCTLTKYPTTSLPFSFPPSLLTPLSMDTQGSKAATYALLRSEGLLGPSWNVTGESYTEMPWIQTVMYNACEWLEGSWRQ
jgi:hypothetical protein